MKSALKSSRQASSQAEILTEIRQQIKAGVLKPGDRLLSYNEMRVRYGVHSVAVQQVYEQLAHAGLIVRKQGRGTFVADTGSAAQPKHSSLRSGIVGVAGAGFTFQDYSPYWVNLLRGIRAATDEAQKQILLLDFKSNRGWEKADGILICDWSSKLTMQWLPPGMPCVSVLVPVEGTVSVYADDHGGGRLATEYLLGLGHRKIAYMHSGDTCIVERRVAGWRDALSQAGLSPAETWVRKMQGQVDFGERFVEHGREAMRAWLESDWKITGCTAILAHNDETAIGIIQALEEAKIRVPEDVSVIGFDGATSQNGTVSRVTTMEIPLEKLGFTAARLISRQLAGEAIEEQHRVFPITLREGYSTGVAKIGKAGGA